jgi:hypothetical protein
MLFTTPAKHLLHEPQDVISAFPSLILLTKDGSRINGLLIDIKSA